MIDRILYTKALAEDWLFRTGPPHALALLRIALGAFLVFYWGLMIPNISMLYSSSGMVMPLYDYWIFAPPNPVVAYLIYLTFLSCLVLLTIGAYMRPSLVIAIPIYMYYWVMSLHLFGTSFDRIFMLILMIVLFSGADSAFSYKMYKKYGSAFEWEDISVFPQRLIALQITITYFGVGMQKLWLPGWQDGGNVLYYAFIGRWGSPIAYWLARVLPTVAFDWMVYITKAFEVMLPFGLWVPTVRKWFFVGGTVFHILIAMLLQIWWFLFLIPSYILFLSPEEAQNLYEECIAPYIEKPEEEKEYSI